MAKITPYYTSDDLVEAVQRKISMPLSQNTVTYDGVLKFANEETYIGQVPSIILMHEEYFVYPITVPLVYNVNRYPIPGRAIGMRLRDLKYQDQSGNLYTMAIIDASDKDFFQANIGTTNLVNKYYLEGNEVVLLPNNQNNVGSLIFYIFLKPNQLVNNDRAAILQSISATPGVISLNFLPNSSFVQINPTNTITIPAHGFTNGNRVQFTATTSIPEGLDPGALYYIVNATTDTFQVSLTNGGAAVIILGVGIGMQTVSRIKFLTKGFLPQDVNFVNDTIFIENHDFANNDRLIFTSNNSAVNPFNNLYFPALPSYQSDLLLYTSQFFPSNGGQLVPNVQDISTLPTPIQQNFIYYVINSAPDTFQISTSIGGPAVDITFVGNGGIVSSLISTLTFDQVPSNITNLSLVDFLQTGAGHKTYGYDVIVPQNGISGNSISFLQTNIPAAFYIGDYVCSANECIIPQIPDDLHNGLAERTSARILAAIGDQAGLQNVMSKIQQIDAAQGTLLDNRVESGNRKVFNKFSLLRLGKSGRNGRM